MRFYYHANIRGKMERRNSQPRCQCADGLCTCEMRGRFTRDLPSYFPFPRDYGKLLNLGMLKAQVKTCTLPWTHLLIVCSGYPTHRTQVLRSIAPMNRL